MYDYRSDIQTIIKAVGSSEHELANGANALQACVNLLNQLDKSSEDDKILEAVRRFKVILVQFKLDIRHAIGNNTISIDDATDKAKTSIQAVVNDTTFSSNKFIASIGDLMLLSISITQSLLIRSFANFELSASGQAFQEHLQSWTNGILSSVIGCIRQYDPDLSIELNTIAQHEAQGLAELNTTEQAYLQINHQLFLSVLEWAQHLGDELLLAANPAFDAYKHLTETLTEFGFETDMQRREILAKTISRYAGILQNTDSSVVKPANLKALISLPDTLAKNKARVIADHAKLPANCYWVQRRLSGMTLMDVNGNQHAFFTESAIHKYDYQTGDILETSERNNALHINNVTGHRDNVAFLDYTKIEQFKYAIVEDHDGRFTINHDLYNNQLMIHDQPVTIEIDHNHYRNVGIKVEDGTLCDLAWYADDSRLNTDPNEAVAIRWIHRDEKPVINVQHNKAPQTETEKHAQDNKNESHTRLDLDLHGQTVGIAVGNGLNQIMAKMVVEKYHGKPRIINAFNIRKHKFAKTLTGVDIIILVQSLANHSSSWNLISALEKFDIKFAVSANLSASSIERALYRAENGLKAFEPSNSKVDYPTITVKEGE